MVDISKAFEKAGERSVSIEKTAADKPVEKMELNLGQQPDDHLYMYHMPYTYIAEQIRKIRTYLFHTPQWSDKRVFMVTSSLPTEGKSLIASNIAVSIARGEDQNVILVDCDLRRPSLYKLFNYPPSPGVSEILQGRKKFNECLLKSTVERLSILPSTVEPPSNPSELLDSKAMTLLFEEIKTSFPNSYIIVDTPPVQATVDPKVISNYVDGIFFVARYRYTRQQDFKASITLLNKEKIVGTILNAVDVMPTAKYKYKKYNYHKYY